jgi:hypothetical protein
MPHDSPEGRAFEKLEDKLEKEIFLTTNFTHLYERQEWVRRDGNSQDRPGGPFVSDVVTEDEDGSRESR